MRAFDSNLHRLLPTVRALFALVLAFAVSGCGGPQGAPDRGPAPFGELPVDVPPRPPEFTLAELRAAVPRAPVFDVPEPPRLPLLSRLPDGWRSDVYPTDIGDMRVYRTSGASEAGPRQAQTPVVVWVHAGVGGVPEAFFERGSGDEHPVAEFVRAGVAVVVPTFRGEHDNPGRYESFYGEVDDLQAAVQYARELPGVDPNYVFVAGHSEGGTLALLASTAGLDVAGILVVGGAADICLVAMNGGYGYEPYRLDRPDQCIVRSAAVFVSHIVSPTWYAEAAGGPYLEVAQEMEGSAREVGVPFRAVGVAGTDHAGAPRLVVPVFAQAIEQAFLAGQPIVLPPRMLSNAAPAESTP